MSILHETIGDLRRKVLDLNEDLRYQKMIVRALIERVEKLEEKIQKNNLKGELK